MSRWERWTDEEVEIVRQCQAKGMTARQASEMLVDRSVAVVRLKAKQAGFPFPSAPPPPAPVVREKERELVRVPDRNYSSFTSRLMGDPAPGRSALDQRGAR